MFKGLFYIYVNRFFNQNQSRSDQRTEYQATTTKTSNLIYITFNQ